MVRSVRRAGYAALSDIARTPAGRHSLWRADPLCMAKWSVLSLSIRYCGSSLEA
jgi:hypothetical protein